MLPRELYGMLYIVYTYMFGIFTCYQEHMVVAHVFDHLYFVEDLGVGECGSFDGVVYAESAIGADVFTLVGQVHGYKQLHGVAKALLGKQVACLSHLFEVRYGGW